MGRFGGVLIFRRGVGIRCRWKGRLDRNCRLTPGMALNDLACAPTWNEASDKRVGDDGDYIEESKAYLIIKICHPGGLPFECNY